MYRVQMQGPVPPRAEELDGFMERHRRHIVKLEQVLRLLENEQVRPSGTLTVKSHACPSTRVMPVAVDPSAEVQETVHVVTSSTRLKHACNQGHKRKWHEDFEDAAAQADVLL